MKKNQNLTQQFKYWSLLATTCLGCLILHTSSDSIEAAQLGVSHIGTFDGSTTFTTSSSNGINPGLFIEVTDDDGNLTQYESEEGIITVPNTKEGAYVTQAKLLGKTKYRDQDTGELLDTWEDGRNLTLESVKMPVLTTTGKNLFNDDLLVNKDIVINIDGVDVYKPIITSNYGVATTSDSGFRLKNNIFKDNTRYTLSFKFTENSSSALHKQIIYRYTDGETYQSWGEREGVVCYTTKANKTLETISVISRNTDGTNFGIYDVQLEEGSVLTDYEPYKSNILSTPEEVVLRSLPNGVCDTLNLLTGEYVQRIGEIVLDGSESWGAQNKDDVSTAYECEAFRDLFANSFSSSFIFSNIPHSPNSYALGTSEGWCIDGHKDIWIRKLNSAIGGSTSNDFKTWLSQNPITVQYQRSTESIKTVALKGTHQFPLLDKSFVQVEGAISPIITSITVPSNSLTFVLNPNQETGQQFIAPEFEVKNESNAPLNLSLKTFEQITDALNDVLPSKYDSWENLTKEQSKDFALGLVSKPSNDWLSRVDQTHWVSETNNKELGSIKPKGTVGFEFIAHHGQAFSEILKPSYRLTLVFDLLN